MTHINLPPANPARFTIATAGDQGGAGVSLGVGFGASVSFTLTATCRDSDEGCNLITQIVGQFDELLISGIIRGSASRIKDAKIERWNRNIKELRNRFEDWYRAYCSNDPEDWVCKN